MGTAIIASGSRTLSSPRQIRDQIYGHVACARYRRRSEDDSRTKALEPVTDRLAILQVSKIVREEALLMLYKKGISLFLLKSENSIELDPETSTLMKDTGIHMKFLFEPLPYCGFSIWLGELREG
ncbi:hypothetical protein MMC28_010468 [Mycoblastus sanguinarius]|nr:hypothetical protein [Mycoblastus sanguinarius]